jgi:hypothetical protein
MTEYQLYLAATLIGQIMPSLTDVFNRYIKNSDIRFWVSMLISGVIGVVMNYNNLNFSNFDHVLVTALLLWSSGQAAYKQWYEGSKLQSSIRFNTRLPGI